MKFKNTNLGLRARNLLPLLFMMLFSGFVSTAQVTVGGPGTSVQRFPMAFWYGYGRSAAIYTSSELNTVTAGGTITTLAWNSTVASSTTAPVVIYIKQVGATTSITSDTWNNMKIGATQVYSGTPASWVIGWNTIDITDLAINAGENIQVMVECNYGGSGGGGQTGTQFTYSTIGTNNFAFWQSDGTAPDALVPTGSSVGGINNNRPDIVFGGLVPPPPPSNDDCANAINLTVDPSGVCISPISGTTIAATASASGTPDPTCNAAGVNDDVWYSFTATAASQVIRISDATNTTAAQIYSGTCGSLTAMTSACNSTSSGTLNAVVNGFSVGQMYYVRVYSTSNAAATTSDFKICVSTVPSMTYTSSTVAQSSTSTVNVGTNNQQIIRTLVTVTGVNNPLVLTQLDYNTNGSANPVTNVSNAKVYYTGTSTTFATTTPFGTAVANPNGTFTITGTQVLTGGLTSTNNYFWLVYDVSCPSSAGDSLDAQNTSFVLDGVLQVPIITDPTGNRKIATPIVTTAVPTTNVVAGSINNQVLRLDITPCTAGSTVQSITFATAGTATAADIANAKVYYTTSTTFGTTTQFGTAVASPNGTFTIVGSQAITATGYFWLVYDLHCSATGGLIIDGSVTNAIVNGATYVPATPNPTGTRTITGLITTSQPSTSSAIAGSVNNQVLRVDVIPCGASSTVEGFTFSTTGTTNVSDIFNAKVYYTTSTTFSSTTQFGTAVANPNGTFTVTGNQAITAIGYFWLVYDLSCAAIATNVVDASVANVTMSGSTYTAATSNPSGTRPITGLIATSQPSTSNATAGSVNNQVLRVDVNPCGASSTITNLVFATAGTATATDISTAKVYYTASTTFATTNQFGTAIANPNGTFTVTGSRAITAIGYFWLVFDLPCSATDGSTIDASLTSVELNGNSYLTTTPNPTGTRTITGAISTLQPSTVSVNQGSNNNQVLRVGVTPCGSSSATVESITFQTQGTALSSDIANAKVYYTSSTTFSATTQYGTAVANPNGTFTVTGNQALTAVGYFWLVYDLAATATPGSIIDASCNAITVSSSVVVPAVMNPTGVRYVAYPMTNDDAIGAYSLIVGAGCTGDVYTNVGSSAGTNEPTSPITATTNSRRVWFKFVAPTSGAVRVSTDVGTTSTLTDSRITLFTTSNPSDYGTFTAIAADDDNGVSSTYGGLGSGFRATMFATGLTSGVEYYVMVEGYSSTTEGTFCIVVDELNNSMLSTTNTCVSAGYQPPVGEATGYAGQVSIVDAYGKLIAIVRNSAGGRVDAYTAAQNINTGAFRQDANGLKYLNRNFAINNSSATNVEVTLFVLNTEITDLNGVDPAVNTVADLKVSHKSGSCSDFSGAAANLITPSTTGSANGVSWLKFITPSFSNFYLHGGNTPLPITLEYFKGEAKATGNVLDWKAAKELNASHYVVERSNDGRSFADLGDVKAKGFDGAEYVFEDKQPLRGDNFYRLRLADRDGTFTHSSVLKLSNLYVADLNLTASPNPFKENVVVTVSGNRAANASVEVIDVAGRTVFAQKVESDEITIDMKSFASGMYMIKYTDHVISKVIKVVKD